MMDLKNIFAGGLAALALGGCSAKIKDGLIYEAQGNGLMVPRESVFGYALGLEKEWKAYPIDETSCMLMKAKDRNRDGKKDIVWLFAYDCGEYRSDWKRPERFLVIDRDKDGLADDVYIDSFNSDGLRFADGEYDDFVFADTFYITRRKEMPAVEDLKMGTFLKKVFFERSE